MDRLDVMFDKINTLSSALPKVTSQEDFHKFVDSFRQLKEAVEVVAQVRGHMRDIESLTNPYV